MKRYIRLAFVYVLIVVVAVLVYAPWALNLRPWDYSVLRAGMSIIAAVALLGVFGTSTYFALKDPEVHLLEPSEVSDDDDVIPALREYEGKPFIGTLASDAISQIESAARKKGRLHKLIGEQFAPKSLSWDRFIVLVDNAYRTILRNSALIANQAQSFDVEVYQKAYKAAKRREKAAAKKAHRFPVGQNKEPEDGVDSSLQSEQLAVYDQSLAEAREILTANEHMLLEMGKLELELSKLDASDQLEENSQTVEELQTLIEETRYYQ